MSRQVDLAIIGGGMVGASLAVALAPLPLRVALIEAVAHDAADQPSFDERTTALSNASRRVFETVGVWNGIASQATAIARIHISDRGRFGFARIEASEQGLPALGYVMPNRVLGRALWASIAAQANLQVHCPARVSVAERSEQAVTLRVTDASGTESMLQARLVVAADGAHSSVRQAFGIEWDVSDYAQTALITTVLAQQFHGFTAYERFTNEGPLALLPMSDGRCTAVLTLSSERARDALQWDDAQYLAELQSRFGFRLGRFLQAGRRSAYPLALTQSAALTAPRCIIMGNAAQSLHPVAGMGFNLGLRDAACLAELLAAGPADAGDANLLSEYAAWRAQDRRGIIGFTDSLVRLFSNPMAGVGMLRNAGLLAFDLLPPAKSALSRLASGTARASRLARGVPLT